MYLQLPIAENYNKLFELKIIFNQAKTMAAFVRVSPI